MEARAYQNQATRIEELIQEVTALPETHVCAKIEELLHALLDIYGEGLKRILGFVAEAEIDDQSLIEKIANDELVGALLLLHGLHPIGLETRLRQALESVRPRIQAYGGALEFVRLEDNVATLRLTGGGCHGCQASGAGLRQMVEEAIYNAAPDLDEIQMEENAMPQQASIPVTFIPLRQRKERVSASVSPDLESDRTEAR